MSDFNSGLAHLKGTSEALFGSSILRMMADVDRNHAQLASRWAELDAGVMGQLFNSDINSAIDSIIGKLNLFAAGGDFEDESLVVSGEDVVNAAEIVKNCFESNPSVLNSATSVSCGLVSPSGLGYIVGVLSRLPDLVSEQCIGAGVRWIVAKTAEKMVDILVGAFLCQVMFGGQFGDLQSGSDVFSRLTHRQQVKIVKNHASAYKLSSRYRVVVACPYLNVRIKPNSKSFVVGRVPQYGFVVVLKKVKKWAFIRYESGGGGVLEGWVCSKYLQKLN